ncbi:MAG: FxsA family protein, partial [Gemmatimonadota bacterium]
MSILGRLALLFVVVPLVELAFLIQVGRWVGIWPTVGLVFLTGILGATLARAEGLRTLWSFQQELASGKLPGQPLLDGLCILVGGALLLTPGFVTDLAGFSLLLPPTRRLLQRGMKRRLRS